MKYIVVQKFDDGSKSGPGQALSGSKSADYEVGEVYRGRDAEKLLKAGLIKEAEPEKKKGKEKEPEKKDSKEKKEK